MFQVFDDRDNFGKGPLSDNIPRQVKRAAENVGSFKSGGVAL